MDEQIKYLEAAKYAVAMMIDKGSSAFAHRSKDSKEESYTVDWTDVFDFLDEQIKMKASWEE